MIDTEVMPAHMRLRQLREFGGYESQKDFCWQAKRRGCRIDLRRYRDIERGDVSPKLYEIVSICTALNISADAWLFGADHRILKFYQLNESQQNFIFSIIEGLEKI